jgi:UDP-N-acetylmuramoyl-tripeptide--D-alanyl-D-alanine ligase
LTAFAWTARRVTAALGLPVAGWDHAYRGVSTDTRTMSEGELFVALKGERYDGHDFLGDARLRGVSGVVVRTGTPRWPGFDWFEVPDTLVALGDLARHRRDAFRGIVVAVTGTNGKTSTRELIAAALSSRLSVHRSGGNLNNLVGVPLTLLAVPEEAEAAVVECGVSEKGEMASLGRIVRPDIAVVTTVAEGHLAGLGTVAGVLEEKARLLEGAATAVVGDSPPELAEAARRAAKRVVVAGRSESADWRADEVSVLPDGRARFTARGIGVELPLRGRHMVHNALIALAVAEAAGVEPETAAAALGGASIPGGRSELLDMDGVTVINDCYNANPASVAAALDLLGAVRGDRKTVVVIGTMRELGDRSAELHRAAAEAVAAIRPDVVAAVGEFAAAFESLRPNLKGIELIAGESPEAVAGPLKDAIRSGDVVLLKASRGVALERLFTLLWPNHSAVEAH